MGVADDRSREQAGVGAAAATWGLLGGTFDPIHYAHLAIAEHVREELGLKGVVFLPAGSPAHKQKREITPAAHRVRMVELAIADNPCFTLSTLEVERSGPTYLVDTLERLSVEPALAVPGASGFVFILSAEALLALRDWRQPERILELCRLAVVPRLGLRMAGRAWVAEHFPGREDRVIFLDGPLLGHSATTIRARAGAGRSIRYLVPPGVERYIVREQLYGGTAPSDR